MPWWSDTTAYMILLLGAVYVIAFVVGFFVNKLGD